MNFEDIKIDLRFCNRWIKKRFPNKDVITLEEFLGDYEDLIEEVDHLEEELKYMQIDLDTNYRRIYHADPYEDRYI